MRKTQVVASFTLLLVVATVITQQESEVGRQNQSRDPSTPLRAGREGAGASIRAASLSKGGNPEAGKQLVMETYGRLPLSFEANHGQTDASVKFLSRGNGYTLFLTATEAVLSLRKSEPRPNQSRDRKRAVQLEPSRPAGSASGGLTPSRARQQAARTGATNNPQIAPISPIVIPETARSSPSVKSAKSADEAAVLRMKLVGANPNAAVAGEDELPGKSNYFIGNDPAKWRTNVPTYAKVRYKDVYPGIDLIYYGEPAPAGRGQRQLEYDFVVAPGADPSVIRLAFPSREREQAVNPNGYPSTTLRAGRERADHQSPDREGGGIHQNRESLEAVPLRIDSQGDLVFDTGDGSTLRLQKPLVYQETSGSRQEIAGSYALGKHGAVSFALAAYDASKPLIIDPVLVYSTYLGGGDQEWGQGIAVDSSGNAYVTGWTSSSNFPTANAFQAAHGGVFGDAFVTKLNAAGSALVYSTYLGGSDGEYSSGIAVDSSGNAYVTGGTNSPDFPTANAFQAAFGGGTCTTARYTYPSYTYPCPDAFVTKLNAAGSALVYSTYLGGSGEDNGLGIAVDSSGNAYLTGDTDSTNFPRANAFRAAIGGGTCGRAHDPYPCPDAFVTKLNAAGSALAYSTFLGGSGVNSLDAGSAIAVDSSGNAYVTGITGSTNFPITANAFQAAYAGGGDAFVTKLNVAGSALIYSTFLGGSYDDLGWGIAVDSFGNAYVTGFTTSTNFPTANAFQATIGGPSPIGFDAFVAKLNAAGSALVYSTYLGGSSGDRGSAIAVDSSRNAYVTGSTNSPNFPITANAFQAGLCVGPSPFNLGAAAFVTKFPAITTSTPPPLQLNQGAVVNGATFSVCAPVAPGSIASLFGAGFGSSAPGGVSVRFGGTGAFLFDVFPTQINFEVPWELSGQSQASLTVTVDGVTSNPVTVPLAPFSPGIFFLGPSGQGAILIASSGEMAAPSGSIPGRAARPAKRGEYITIYATGLGPVTNRPASGTAAPAIPLSITTTLPTVTVEGVVPATVSFSGLAPGFVGLYQVNVQVPENAPTGDRVAVGLSIGGVMSNTVIIAVQ